MTQFQFTVAGQFPERRSFDRRRIDDAESKTSPKVWRRYAFLLAIFIGFNILIWQRQYIINGPLWLARVHWADRSDLYLGTNNGLPNQLIVGQARNYLTDIDHLDASGNVMAPEDLRPVGVHLNSSWFKQHVPDSVNFDPFNSKGGRFEVSWLYYPGCQKTIWRSPRIDTDWYSLGGRPCFPVCRVTVLMTLDLRLTSITITAPTISL